MDLSNIEFFFLDIEDTLIKWNETVLGAKDMVNTLEDQKKKVYFHTNNSLLTRKQMAEKLKDIGIKASEEQVITSGYVVARQLEEKRIDEVYALGEEGVFGELQNRGVSIRKESETVVAGLDRQFNYSKLSRVASKESPEIYICDNRKFLTSEEEQMPGPKPIKKALSVYGNTEMIGKPSQHYIDIFKDYFSFMPDNSLMVGDRLSDIETGNKLGMNTALLMSGTTSKEDLKDAESYEKPNFGISNLTRLTRRLKK